MQVLVASIVSNIGIGHGCCRLKALRSEEMTLEEWRRRQVRCASKTGFRRSSKLTRPPNSAARGRALLPLLHPLQAKQMEAKLELLRRTMDAGASGLSGVEPCLADDLRLLALRWLSSPQRVPDSEPKSVFFCTILYDTIPQLTIKNTRFMVYYMYVDMLYYTMLS